MNKKPYTHQGNLQGCDNRTSSKPIPVLLRETKNHWITSRGKCDKYDKNGRSGGKWPMFHLITTSITPLPPLQYKVLTLISNNWEDAWMTEENGVESPTSFTSKAYALQAIKDHIQDCKEAVKEGRMDDYPSLKDFKIIPVQPLIVPE